jgi:hypothetical protein
MDQYIQYSLLVGGAGPLLRSSEKPAYNDTTSQCGSGLEDRERETAEPNVLLVERICARQQTTQAQ